jgi:predicted aspartyl protease
MRSETSFEFHGDLIIVEALAAGPNGRAVVHLVLDTGAVLTTLVPELAESIGSTSSDRVARSIVRSAVGDEHGYVVLMSLSARGLVRADLHVNVADLGPEIDGLLGMNYLSELNFEVRPAQHCILVEPIPAALSGERM